jgi:iron(III) transport system permease protein
VPAGSYANRLNQLRITRLQPLSHFARLKGFDLKALIFLGVITILLWQVSVPLFMIIYGSFKTVSPGSEGFWSFSFTLTNFVRGYSQPLFISSLINTLTIATGSAFLGWAIAFLLAWVVERTDAPFRQIIFAVSLARMILPGILTTLAWIMLLSPNIGLINKLAMGLPLIEHPPFNVYSIWGIIWIMGIDLIPTSFLLMWAALRSVDPALEEAAATAGSGPLGTLYRVTLPMIRPAVIAVWLLAWIRGIENFEVPALVGYPHGINTFSTQIYYSTATTPVDYGLSSAYAMALLITSIIAIFFYLRATRVASSFMTITGKGYRPQRINLGGWRYLAAGISLFVLFITIGLPLLVLVYESFLPYPQPFSWQSFRHMNLDQYSVVWFAYGDTLLAFVNSSIVSITSATIIVVLVSIISWITVRTKIRGRGLLDILAFAPTAVPGLVLGLSFLWLYLAVPWGSFILGSVWIITLAMVTNWMPFAMRTVAASMVQIHTELEEASYVAGASWFKTFRSVLVPLFFPGVLAAWIWVVVHAFRDVTTSIMLFSQSNQTVGVLIFLLFERGTYNTVAALGVILMGVLTLLVILMHWTNRRFGIYAG